MNIFEKLKSIEALEDNWDGYGSPKISKEVLDTTESLLVDILQRNFKISSMSPTGDNEIVISFGNSENFIDISIESKEQARIYAKIKGVKTHLKINPNEIVENKNVLNLFKKLLTS